MVVVVVVVLVVVDGVVDVVVVGALVDLGLGGSSTDASKACCKIGIEKLMPCTRLVSIAVETISSFSHQLLKECDVLSVSVLLFTRRLLGSNFWSGFLSDYRRFHLWSCGFRFRGCSRSCSRLSGGCSR